MKKVNKIKLAFATCLLGLLLFITAAGSSCKDAPAQNPSPKEEETGSSKQETGESDSTEAEADPTAISEETEGALASLESSSEEPIHVTGISFDDPSDVTLRIGQTSARLRATVTLKKELEYSRDDIRFVSKDPEIAVINCVNSLYGEYYFLRLRHSAKAKHMSMRNRRTGQLRRRRSG